MSYTPTDYTGTFSGGRCVETAVQPAAMATAVTFDYNDFNTSTRRNVDTRKHGAAEIRKAAEGGVYIFGDLGCGKTRDNVRDALIAYLGGRELLAHRVFD